MNKSDMAGLLGLLIGGAGGYYGGQRRASREEEMLDKLLAAQTEGTTPAVDSVLGFDSGYVPGVYGSQAGESSGAKGDISTDTVPQLEESPGGSAIGSIIDTFKDMFGSQLNEGGVVPKRGLVDEPGGYAGIKEYLNPFSFGLRPLPLQYEITDYMMGGGLPGLYELGQALGFYNQGGRVGMQTGGVPNPYANLGYSWMNNIFSPSGMTTAPGTGFQTFDDGITNAISIPGTNITPSATQTPAPIIPPLTVGGGLAAQRGSGPEDRGTFAERFGTTESRGYGYEGTPGQGGSATYNNPAYGELGDTFTPAPGLGIAYDQYGRRVNIGMLDDAGLNLYNAAYPAANAVQQSLQDPVNLITGAVTGIPFAGPLIEQGIAGLGNLLGFGQPEEESITPSDRQPGLEPNIRLGTDLSSESLGSLIPSRRPTPFDPRIALAMNRREAEAAAEAVAEANQQRLAALSDIGFGPDQVDPQTAEAAGIARADPEDSFSTAYLGLDSPPFAPAVVSRQPGLEPAPRQTGRPQGATFERGEVRGPLGQGQTRHSSMSRANSVDVANRQMQNAGFAGAVTNVNPQTGVRSVVTNQGRPIGYGGTAIQRDQFGDRRPTQRQGSGACFLAGTLITMADESKKPIEEIELMDKVAVGGYVGGVGKFLTNELHDYEGVKVSGSHLVNEDDKWIYVKDSKKSKPLGDDTHVVYVLGTEHRRLLIENILFTDYLETKEQKMFIDHGHEYFFDNHGDIIHDTIAEENLKTLNAEN